MHARLLRASRHAIIRQAANALPLRNGANARRCCRCCNRRTGTAQGPKHGEIEAQGYRGWLQRENWGVYAFERLD